MIKKHEKTTVSLDDVLHEYSDASENFDADILDEYINRYPEYADRLRNYASVWLMSRCATPEEIASEVVPEQEMLKTQSRLLSRLHSMKESNNRTEEVGVVIERLKNIKGTQEFDRVAQIILGDFESDDEELLIEEYIDPGLVKEPFWIKERFGEVLECSPELVPIALVEYRSQVSHHYSANGKPAKIKPRNWIDAVESLSISQARKKMLSSLVLENK